MQLLDCFHLFKCLESILTNVVRVERRCDYQLQSLYFGFSLFFFLRPSQSIQIDYVFDGTLETNHEVIIQQVRQNFTCSDSCSKRNRALQSKACVHLQSGPRQIEQDGRPIVVLVVLICDQVWCQNFAPNLWEEARIQFWLAKLACVVSHELQL